MTKPRCTAEPVPYPTVWSYMTVDRGRDGDDHRPRRRTVFFEFGSTIYDGSWLRPTDCVWIVPDPFPWQRE